MYELNELQDITDSPEFNNLTQSNNNSRVATRFVRKDINATINIYGLLGIEKTLVVCLLDITSKGVLIATNQKLSINKKITLALHFRSGKEFVIKGIVARHSNSAPHEYGIKFDQYNHELGDYMLETQEQLIFK